MSGESPRSRRNRKEREERRAEGGRRAPAESFARERGTPKKEGGRTTGVRVAERSHHLCGNTEEGKRTLKHHRAMGKTARATVGDPSHLDRMAVLRATATRQAARCARRDARWPARNGFFLSVQHALDRYRVISENFDRARFSIGANPLVVGCVPWPAVVHPSRLVGDDGRGVQGSTSWEDVEHFLQGVKQILRPAEYQDLLRKVRLQFHPDKWASRGILESVLDDELRVQLHTWCVIVSQAVNAAC
ncbi:uncharacterized protein SCHCODRAFT_02752836 [Schizophyllum commune H4-8]|uniref:Uncharacterized protein n=1 Tax=Schizophyllum commune (strain H4-8 / FGSC 9210) TaxID=578458 RepID=D8QJH8_SCHCM|nr:uncharacterized protein SCHCODRAFT_02752836 [Schizophyllum commune H4-8]KAI5886323.1 hypothetical protein SCHCODRAFT_02752836 [Schizophyllum commune H4-8]